MNAETGTKLMIENELKSHKADALTPEQLEILAALMDRFADRCIQIAQQHPLMQDRRAA